LYLSGTEVDDALVTKLGVCSKLRFVGISGTRITKEGVEKLEGLLPNATVFANTE
jgi:hypothetical protein